MDLPFPVKSAFLMDGPSGNLEVIVDMPKPDVLLKPVVGILCHPHPLFGGTMNNKVVTSMSWAWTQLGMPVVRFNYRGVGNSQGVYGHFTGETEDLACIIAWVKQHFPQHAIKLGGFSFGCFIAAQGAKNESLIQQLLMIAPAVNHADFYSLTDIHCPWSVIQGDKDEVVPPQEVYNWAHAFKEKLKLKIIPDADHFFNGQIVTLRQAILAVTEN